MLDLRARFANTDRVNRTSASLRSSVVLGAMACFALSGCASSTPTAAEPSGPTAPAWTNKTSYIEGRTLYGVGIVAGIRNRGLAMSAAGNRARAEIAKLTEVYTAQLMKDYSSSISTGDLSNSSEEQLIEQATKTFSAQLQVGVQIVDRYFDDANRIIYALAQLDLDKQATVAAARSKMSDQYRSWVQDNQDRVLGQVGGESTAESTP